VDLEGYSPLKFIDEWIRGQSVFTIHDNKDRCFQNVRPSF